ncbi:MAG TPA: DUF2173 family protein [Candidatus Competibacteraceae bacterium]|nr:DUF2173 family protein [Candidatus Competibacteraceae bacterium]
MATIEQLMDLPGALAAFEFRGSGELLNHSIRASDLLNPEILDLLAHVCAANMSIAAMQARGLDKLTNIGGFYPVHEFTLLGFDWSVVISAHQRESRKTGGNEIWPPFIGVVLSNNQADYGAALRLLES